MKHSAVVEVQRLRADVELPVYATVGAAGADLRAALETAIVIKPAGIAKIPTGLAVALPTGFEAQVRPRSGLAAKHGVTVLNAPGTIDCDYRGEIQVLLVNHGTADFTIHNGDRIAQLVVAPTTRATWTAVEALGHTERAAGGFGSTGV